VPSTSTDVENVQGGGPLVNDNVVYDVYVRSIDGYTNASVLSVPGSGKAITIEDFYAHYRLANGSAVGGGGCASGGSGWMALLGALGALAWRRRRVAGAAVVGALLVVAPAARAEAPGNWTGQNRPPRYLLIGFKVDRYDPQVDTEHGLIGTPYHDIFHGKAPGRYQLEVDWEAAHPYGAILIGGTVGFWQIYGHGIVASTGAQSSDTTHVNIMPVTAVVTYRFDEFADRYRWFPFIPYAQFGLGAALWSSYDGRGDISSNVGRGGGRGSGWTRGYTTALGIAVSLDAIDPQLAREAFIDMGVQRTAAFAEYGWTRLDNFRKGGAMVLSDRAWRFGVSVEF
jgi:MYXO-CTERM domain-containing protein